MNKRGLNLNLHPPGTLLRVSLGCINMFVSIFTVNLASTMKRMNLNSKNRLCSFSQDDGSLIISILNINWFFFFLEIFNSSRNLTLRETELELMREENWKLLIPVERGWYLLHNQISVTAESENLREFFIFGKRVANACCSLRECLQPSERAAEAVARVRDGGLQSEWHPNATPAPVWCWRLQHVVAGIREGNVSL